MKENYNYPLDLSWSAAEMSTVLSFFNQVEQFYEAKVEKNQFLTAYKKFKAIVPSKMQEKQLGREFEAASGYSIYRAVKAVQESEKSYVKA